MHDALEETWLTVGGWGGNHQEQWKSSGVW